MILDELEKLVIQWAYDKGIIGSATCASQMTKTLEEVVELNTAVHKHDLDEIIDGIGDTTVTLILQAHMQGTSLAHCLGSAYKVIAGRTGKMVDGVFVKDE